MTDFVEYLPQYHRLCGMLRKRQSILLYAPRHYATQQLLESLHRAASGEGAQCVTIFSLGQPATGRLDFGALWEERRQTLGVRGTYKVTDGISFAFALARALETRRRKRRCVFFVQGACRGNESNHFDMVSAFMHFLRKYQGDQADKPSVVATDDYSLWYYNQARMPISDWVPLQEVHLNLLTIEEIFQAITRMGQDNGLDLPPERARELAAVIHRISGGHAGLVAEMVEEIEAAQWVLPLHYSEPDAANALRSSAILTSINRVLGEDPRGYCQTALGYRAPDIPEPNSPPIHLLHQIGVLHRVKLSMLQLCPGAIARVVEQTWERVEENGDSSPTPVSPYSGRIFETSRMQLHDDDLVVVHLSDLHVCNDHYRFRLAVPGGPKRNSGERPAPDLLSDDLRAMGLEGRVDALVLTGDFAWSGETDEFRLARALIDELIKRLKLSLDHVLLVPGNHDMTWNPSPLAPAHDKQSVSRANYDDFIELLKQKRPTSESELLPIVSRSGRIKLRLLGLDSNRVEGPKAAGLGYVSPEAFHEAARLLEADPTDGFEQVFTWILVHHHVFPATSVQLEDALEKRVSLMGNALDLQQHAAHWQAEAILHGHEHQPSVTVAARWPVELGQQFTPLTVIGAGSFSAKRDKLGPFSRNHYYVLYRRAEDIIVRSRQLGESLNVFVPHNDMILPQQPRPWGTRASQKRATGEAVGPGPMPAAV